MITDKEIRRVCEQLPGGRVLESYIMKRIGSVRYHKVDTLTICIITLDNGYFVESKGDA